MFSASVSGLLLGLQSGKRHSLENNVLSHAVMRIKKRLPFAPRKLFFLNQILIAMYKERIFETEGLNLLAS